VVTRAHAKFFAACSVFTNSCLATASNNDYSSASGLTSSPNGGCLPTDSILGWRPFHTNLLVFSSQPDFHSRALTVSAGMFTEPFHSSCRLFLLIKNLLPGNGRSSVVGFVAVAYKRMLFQSRSLATALSLAPQFLF
jgi:hypothetical protein